MQKLNLRLSERLKEEKVANEKVQLLQLQQNKTLLERCNQLECDLSSAASVRVICSICFDAVDEIIRTKRSVLSTFCGHIFCDHCLHQSMLSSKSNKNEQNKKRQLAKFAHTLFI